MGRLAALLILVSQLLLLWVVFETSGGPSIWFTFVGHPLVVAGCVLGLWVLARRLLRDAHDREREVAGHEER